MLFHNFIKRTLALFLLCSLSIFEIHAQITVDFQVPVGINSDNSDPDVSSMLDIKSTDKGILIPRMTNTQRDTIDTPATGLLVFVTTDSSFYFYNGMDWAPLNSDIQDLSLSGNTLSLTGDGTSVDLTNYSPDNLGNHTATQTFLLDDYWLSNDGGDEGIRIEDNGNVGVGKIAGSKLDVNGDIQLSGELKVVDGNQTFILRTNEVGNYVQMDAGGSGHSSDSIYIGDYTLTSNEVIMNGKVGVGTKNLTDKLNVKGDVRIHRTSSTSDNSSVLTIEGSQNSGVEFARIDFQNLDRNTDTDYVGARIIASNGLGSEDGDLRFYTTTSGDVGDFHNQVMRINKGASVGIGTGSVNIFDKFQVGISGDGTKAIANQWDTWSDQRLKKELSPIDKPISKLAQLNGYYYYWKGEGKNQRRQVGIVAQEVEAVLPELVSTNAEDIKSVDYAKLVALLIEVNKVQQIQLDAATEQTELLHQKVTALEMQNAKINQIEAMVLEMKSEN